MKNQWLRSGIIAMTLPGLIAAPALGGGVRAQEGDATSHTLAIMGTTDIHAHVMAYDYMADKPDDSFGLAKVASIVEEQRNLYDHSILVDAGDTLQGSILGDLEAVVDPVEGEKNVILQAMEAMDYHAAAIGNHEFNFGLDFLDRSIADSAFPWLNANVKNASDGEPRFDPYLIEEMEIDGETLKVGMIGFVPPQIMTWDRMHLEGHVEVDEIIDSAEEFVPKMKAEGADVVVAVAHSGIDASEDASADASWHLTNVEGIDAVVSGHNHNLFPEEAYHDLPGVDPETGQINGTPVVMPGSWGSHLGIIELDLMHDDDEWMVQDSRSFNLASVDYEEHPDIVEIAADRHQATIDYVNNPVGETKRDINTFFARLLDNETNELVNAAQLHYATAYLKGTDYEDFPLLSAAAPFRAGRGGPGYFTDVQETIAIKDVADIYIYPNTLHIVKVDGYDLHQWLEKAAGNFFEIDPQSTDTQMMADYSFRGYNFDTIDGVEYQIDITKPLGERILNLTYQGETVVDDEEYLVITNNYRASGGGGLLSDAESAEIIYSSTLENREVIIDYIREKGTLDIEPDMNWSIVPFDHEGDLHYKTSPAALDYLERSGGYDFLSYVETDADGWAVFSFDMDEYRSMLDGEAPVFSDYGENENYFEEVRHMASLNVIQGFKDGTFRPMNDITRADVAVMVARAFDLEHHGDDLFQDVNQAHRAFDDIHAVKDAGIFLGTVDHEFLPDAMITRGEAAAVIARAFDFMNDDVSNETTFHDVHGVFSDYIGTLENMGIVHGISEGYYGMDAHLTRLQFTIMMSRSHNHSVR